jgi:hypothetical protein
MGLGLTMRRTMLAGAWAAALTLGTAGAASLDPAAVTYKLPDQIE